MNEVAIKRGKAPPRERWGLSQIKKDHYAEFTNLGDYGAIRAAASRTGKRLKRSFSVRKENTEDKPPREVIRVYRST